MKLFHIIIQALNLFTTALGSWLMIPLVFLVNSGWFGSPWIPENLDDGQLANYFFLLAGIMFLNQVFVLLFRVLNDVSSFFIESLLDINIKLTQT